VKSSEGCFEGLTATKIVTTHVMMEGKAAWDMDALAMSNTLAGYLHL